MVFMVLKLQRWRTVKKILSHWRADFNEFPQLHRHVQQFIGLPPWMTEKHFGYQSVSRDMRSLHVEGMMPGGELFDVV
jgi:hypothetical protein